MRLILLLTYIFYSTCLFTQDLFEEPILHSSNSIIETSQSLSATHQMVGFSKRKKYNYATDFQYKFPNIYYPNGYIIPTNNHISVLSRDTTRKRNGFGKLMYIIKPVVNIDARRSYFLGRWITINGFRLGFEMFEKYRFGWGFYNSKPTLIGREVRNGKDYDLSMSFSYFNAFTDYVFFEDYKWEIAGSFSFGIGSGSLHIDSKDTAIVTSTPTFPVLELNVSTEYKIYPWLGVGTGVGLRQVLPNEKTITTADEIKKAFNGPLFMVRVKIHFGPLLRYFFNRKGYMEDKQEYHELKNKRRENRKLKKNEQ